MNTKEINAPAEEQNISATEIEKPSESTLASEETSNNSGKGESDTIPKPNEVDVMDWMHGRSLESILADTSDSSCDGQPLSEDKVYSLAKIGNGIKIYWIKENRKSFKRGYNMYTSCTNNGMTTPAVVVDAKVVHEWGLCVVDPITGEEITDPEELEEGVCIMEGHGRFFAYVIAMFMKDKYSVEPFDFRFVYKKYDSPEDFGKAYISTNADMTPTTNTDRLNIAIARTPDPLHKECIRKVEEDYVIAKASNFFTYGRELTKKEVKALMIGDSKVLKFDKRITDALKIVYDAFKTKFCYDGASEIYRGVPAAKWTASKIKNPETAHADAISISKAIKNMSAESYTVIITAKKQKETGLTREQVIMNELNKAIEVNI